MFIHVLVLHKWDFSSLGRPLTFPSGDLTLSKMWKQGLKRTFSFHLVSQMVNVLNIIMLISLNTLLFILIDINDKYSPNYTTTEPFKLFTPFSTCRHKPQRCCTQAIKIDLSIIQSAVNEVNWDRENFFLIVLSLGSCYVRSYWKRDKMDERGWPHGERDRGGEKAAGVSDEWC